MEAFDPEEGDHHDSKVEPNVLWGSQEAEGEDEKSESGESKIAEKVTEDQRDRPEWKKVVGHEDELESDDDACDEVTCVGNAFFAENVCENQETNNSRCSKRDCGEEVGLKRVNQEIIKTPER